MMKTAVVRGFLSVVMLILLSGCAGLLPGTAGEKTEGEPKKAEEPQETEAEHEPAPVTVEEVESSLMQLTIQMNTVSDFQDYSNGDAGFEESLAILFLLDRRPDPEKQGALRAVYKETGEIYHEYARAVVDRKEDSRLWRFIHTVEGETLEFEVLVDDNKIPREVRYEDPYTEEEIQRSTRFDVLMKQAEDNSIRADIIRSLVRQKREETRSKLPAYYRDLEIIGEETIEQAGKTLEAVHLSRKLGEEFGGDLHVWYSRDVTGGIIRVRIGKDVPKVGIEKWEPQL